MDQYVTGELQTETSPVSDEDLARVLRIRAGYARDEGDGTSIGDALHFEAAAAAIERLTAKVARLGGFPDPDLHEAMEGVVHFADAVAYRTDPLAVALRQWIEAGRAAIAKAEAAPTSLSSAFYAGGA